MLLDSLKVQAFRGIKNELPLDLRARLTLIHAPNGVGKTSLCDAVEWLFTGEVERLREPLGKSKGKGVSNIFTSRPPQVESGLRNGNGSTVIRRGNLAKANEIEIRAGGKWRKERLNTLLASITPDKLPQSSKGLQQLNNRRSWFRAVRLLETHALDLLLDTNDSSNEVRDLVFSDLLGVGELQRQERDLTRIVSAIGGKVRLREDLLRIKREINSLESEITTGALQAGAPSYETYQEQISAASQRMGIVLLGKPGSPESHLASVENAYKLADKKLAEQHAALVHVKSGATNYSLLKNEILLIDKEQEEINLRRTQAENELEAATILLQRTEDEVSKAEALERLILTQPLDLLKGSLERTLVKWRDQGCDLKTKLDLVALQTDLVDARANEERAKGLLETVTRCDGSLEVWREARSREQAANTTIMNIKLPSSEDRTRLAESLSDTKSKLASIEAQFNHLAGPIEQLRIAGLEFIKGLENEQRCPLCAHDHQTPVNLRKAIDSSVSNIPESLNSLSRQREDLEANVLTFEQQLTTWSEAARNLESYTAEREDARLLLIQAKTVFDDLNLDLNNLADDSLSRQILELKLKTENELRRASELTTDRERRFNIGSELHSISGEITSRSKRIQVLTVSAPIVDLKTIPLSDWTGVLEEVQKTAELSLAQVRSELTRSRVKVQEAQADVNRLRDSLEMFAVSNAKLSDEFNKIRTEIEMFDTQWHLVGGEQLWDQQLLAQQQVLLDQMEENLSKAKQEIESARRALIAARESESTERDRMSRQRQLADLHSRLRELEGIDEVRRQCVKGAEALRLAKDAFVKEQIQPLCDVITALYVRAQSATFIDRIDSSQEKGPMRWLACIGEHRLEDTAQMSLGQRQDLALAIFLSRARELGGTFFMDEPLLNLDDLNRIAVLDVLRTIVIEQTSRPVRLVVTTANHSLVQHCKEKFRLVQGAGEEPSLRTYRLFGDPQSGVSAVVDN